MRRKCNRDRSIVGPTEWCDGNATATVYQPLYNVGPTDWCNGNATATEATIIQRWPNGVLLSGYLPTTLQARNQGVGGVAGVRPNPLFANPLPKPWTTPSEHCFSLHPWRSNLCIELGLYSWLDPYNHSSNCAVSYICLPIIWAWGGVWERGSMVRWPIGPKTHLSKKPLVRWPVGLKTHWSDGPLV